MNGVLQAVTQYTNQIIIALSVLLLVLVMLIIVLMRKMQHINKMIKHVLPESEQDFLAILDEQRTWNEQTDKKIVDLETQDQRLLSRINHGFQYRGIETYSAFDNGGRELSFSVAMLDAHLNGWVLSSLYAGAEGSSVYFKEIRKGTPKERLTPEEERALQKAMKEKS